MTSNFYFTATSRFPENVPVKPHSKHSAGVFWVLCITKILFFRVYLTGRYVPQPTTAPPYVGGQHLSTSTDWAILLYPEPTKSTEDNAIDTYKTPSMLPVPPPNDNDEAGGDPDKGKDPANANYVDYDQV